MDRKRDMETELYFAKANMKNHLKEMISD